MFDDQVMILEFTGGAPLVERQGTAQFIHRP